MHVQAGGSITRHTTQPDAGLSLRSARRGALRPARTPMPMDRHEKGIEKAYGRVDRPLPEWKGSYGGDPRRLPKVVQKLMQRKTLTAEEKAELLWRFYEIDQSRRTRQAKVWTTLLVLVVLGAAAYLAFYQRQWVVNQVMAWLSPPATPPV